MPPSATSTCLLNTSKDGHLVTGVLVGAAEPSGLPLCTPTTPAPIILNSVFLHFKPQEQCMGNRLYDPVSQLAVKHH